MPKGLSKILSAKLKELYIKSKENIENIKKTFILEKKIG